MTSRSHRRWPALSLVVLGGLLALLAAPAARAESQDFPSVEPSDLKKMDIEELMAVQVSTISRQGERLDQAPGSIFVYPREVIRQRGHRSLADLLRSVPGFTVFHRDTQFVVGIRGLNANDNDKMSLLINGQRVLGLHEQELLNGPINLDNVERVEVVVGPSSLFQQADTLAATVNLITRRAEQTELMLATGTALVYSGSVLLGKSWGTERYLSLSLTTEQKRGFDAWVNPSRPFLPGRKVTGRLDWPSFFAVANGQFDQLSAQLVAYRSSWPELWIDGAHPSNDGQFIESFYSGLLKLDHPFTAGLRSVLTVETALKSQERSNAGGPPINATSQTVKQWQHKADLSFRYDGGGHKVQAGAQASLDDNFDTFFTFDDTSGSTPVHILRTTIVDQDTHAYGFYLDDEYQVVDQLKLVAGVRIDQNTRLARRRWFPAWRSAVIFQPFKIWVAKAVFYRAVRMPSPFEALNRVFGTNNPDGPNKPAFANLSPTADWPETLTTFELHNILYLGQVRLGTTLYRQSLEDFITWFQPHSNGGDFRGNGAEVSVQAPFNPAWTVWGNGAFNDSKLHLFRPEVFGTISNTPENVHSYVNDDDRIIGSVRYTANLGVDARLWGKLHLSPAMRYFTEQAAFQFRTAAEGGAYQKTLRNRVYFDATVSWQGLRLVDLLDVDVRLSVYNLLNDRRPVGAQLFADTYRPRGINGVLSADLKF